MVVLLQLKEKMNHSNLSLCFLPYQNQRYKKGDGWGARSIQCGRIKISICKDTVLSTHDKSTKKNIGIGCWDKVCMFYKIPSTHMTFIIAYAKRMAKKAKKSYWRYGSLNLILINSLTKQQEHLDLAAPLAQFALIISHNVDTTITYKVTASIKVKSMLNLGDLLAGSSKTWNGLGNGTDVE